MKFIRQHKFHVSNGGADAMPVGGNTTYYTDAINIEKGESFSLEYKAAVTSGAADLAINLEQSDSPAATAYASDANFTVGADVSAVETSLSSTTRKHKSIAPNMKKWIRLKIAGAGGNSANATLEATISIQEEN